MKERLHLFLKGPTRLSGSEIPPLPQPRPPPHRFLAYLQPLISQQLKQE